MKSLVSLCSLLLLIPLNPTPPTVPSTAFLPGPPGPLASLAAPSAVQVAEPVGKSGPPPATASAAVRLPDSDLDLSLSWRQLGDDLARFAEDPQMPVRELHRLRVMSTLAFDGKLTSDVTFRASDHRFRPGTYPMAFTVNQGGRPVFFLVDGTQAVPLADEELDPGWAVPHMQLQLIYVGSREVHLLWHHGTRAGRIAMTLGAQLR